MRVNQKKVMSSSHHHEEPMVSVSHVAKLDRDFHRLQDENVKLRAQLKSAASKNKNMSRTHSRATELRPKYESLKKQHASLVSGTRHHIEDLKHKLKHSMDDVDIHTEKVRRLSLENERLKNTANQQRHRSEELQAKLAASMEQLKHNAAARGHADAELTVRRSHAANSDMLQAKVDRMGRDLQKTAQTLQECGLARERAKTMYDRAERERKMKQSEAQQETLRRFGEIRVLGTRLMHDMAREGLVVIPASIPESDRDVDDHEISLVDLHDFFRAMKAKIERALAMRVIVKTRLDAQQYAQSRTRGELPALTSEALDRYLKSSITWLSMFMDLVIPH